MIDTKNLVFLPSYCNSYLQSKYKGSYRNQNSYQYNCSVWQTMFRFHGRKKIALGLILFEMLRYLTFVLFCSLVLGIELVLARQALCHRAVSLDHFSTLSWEIVKAVSVCSHQFCTRWSQWLQGFVGEFRLMRSLT